MNFKTLKIQMKLTFIYCTIAALPHRSYLILPVFISYKFWSMRLSVTKLMNTT